MQSPSYENPGEEVRAEASERWAVDSFVGEGWPLDAESALASRWRPGKISVWRNWVRSLALWRRGTKVGRARDAWYRSLDLRDRQRLLARGDLLALPAADPTVDALLGRWRSQAPFHDDHWFRERLARDGFDAHEFPRLLSTSGKVSRNLPEKADWRRLERSYLAAAAGADQDLDPQTSSLWVEPLLKAEVERALDVFERRAKAMESAGEGAIAHPIPSSRRQLRLLLVEGCRRALNRFASWMLEDPEAPSLEEPRQIVEVFQRLPVLARQLQDRTRAAVGHGIEVLERSAMAWSDLRADLLDGSDPGRLDRLELRLGLGSRGGRAVTRLTFEDGRRLLYKPRSLAAEQHLRHLVGWLAERQGAWGTDLAGFARSKLPRVLDCENHGFMEWIDGANPSDAVRSLSPAELRVLATQAGRWMAILYLLGGRWQETDWRVETGSGALLPVDASHLFERPLEGVGEEPWNAEACLESLTLGGHMRPTFVRAFAAAYRSILDLRTELVDIDGPLEAFRALPMRMMPRARDCYRDLLRESLRPRFLRDAAERELCFDRLWQDVPEKPHLARLVSQEKRQLWRGDRPELEYRPGSLHLWTPEGDRIDDAFERSAMWHLRQRLDAMGEEDLARISKAIGG